MIDKDKYIVDLEQEIYRLREENNKYQTRLYKLKVFVDNNKQELKGLKKSELGGWEPPFLSDVEAMLNCIDCIVKGE